MTIRLRLTLMYSSILALTLIVFGLALYSIQSQDTMNSLRQDLRISSDQIADALRKTSVFIPEWDPAQPNPPPPRPFHEVSNAPAFRELREREIVRVLDPVGNLMASPFGREEDALPLSEDALAAIQQGEDWYESGIVNDENMLIYNRPIMVRGELTYIVQVARSLTERNRTLNSLATTLSIAGLITILIAFGVGWFISGLTLRPIGRMTQTAHQIGEDRDFSRRVAYSGKQDEIGQLATTFNQMLAQLQDAYEKVEHALQQQRNFVTDVSHELRTPLTTLRGNLGLLLRRPPAPDGVQEDILTDMVDESDRLIRLVNDLLLMARADADRSLVKEMVAIRPVLEDAVHQAQQLNDQRQIRLDVPEDISIRSDEDALRQIILILLDNACKYSEGAIDVEGKQVGSRVEIRVRDYGEGIASEDLSHIFDRFYRANENTFVPGFGLGLAIAKSLVEGMEGTIELESELGKGSTAILSFPIVKTMKD